MDDACTTPFEDSTMLPVQLAMPLALMVGAAIAATTTPKATHPEEALHDLAHLLDDGVKAWAPCAAARPDRAARRCWCSSERDAGKQLEGR
jgi:hypothetical protein